MELCLGGQLTISRLRQLPSTSRPISLPSSKLAVLLFAMYAAKVSNVTVVFNKMRVIDEKKTGVQRHDSWRQAK